MTRDRGGVSGGCRGGGPGGFAVGADAFRAVAAVRGLPQGRRDQEDTRTDPERGQPIIARVWPDLP